MVKKSNSRTPAPKKTTESSKEKRYVISCSHFTCWLKTDTTKLQRITSAAPIIGRFIGQPLGNLTTWIRNSTSLRLTEIPNLKIVLVCGGRDYANQSHVFQVLDSYYKASPFEMLVHGGANGADALAGEWAEAREVPCSEYPADWKKHGRAAGMIRNQLMLDDAGPDLVIAFPGGRGTENMIYLSRKAGVPVHEKQADF